MSDKWTDKLRGVSFSKMTKVTVKDNYFDQNFDTHMERYPPGMLFSNDANLSRAFDVASVYHGLYMTPECSAPEDYADFDDSGWTGSYITGLMRLDMQDDTGRNYSKYLPVIYSSSTTWSPEAKPNQIGLASSVRGLFAGLCMIVSASDSPDDTRATNLHETVHAMVASLPELRQIMYGDDEWTKAEESVVHLVTDKASMLGSLNDIQFKQSVEEYTGFKGGGKNRRKVGVMKVHSIEDIILKGESLITNNITIDLSTGSVDDEVKEYKKLKKGYFLL